MIGVVVSFNQRKLLCTMDRKTISPRIGTYILVLGGTLFFASLIQFVGNMGNLFSILLPGAASGGRDSSNNVGGSASLDSVSDIGGGSGLNTSETVTPQQVNRNKKRPGAPLKNERKKARWAHEDKVLALLDRWSELDFCLGQFSTDLDLSMEWRVYYLQKAVDLLPDEFVKGLPEDNDEKFKEIRLQYWRLGAQLSFYKSSFPSWLRESVLNDAAALVKYKGGW